MNANLCPENRVRYILYGIGSGLPIMLVGTAAGGVLRRLDCSRFENWIDPIVGGLLILLGFYLLWRM